MTIKEKVLLVLIVLILPVSLIYWISDKKEFKVLKNNNATVLTNTFEKAIAESAKKLKSESFSLDMNILNKQWDLKKDSFVKSFNIVEDRFSKDNSKSYLHKNFSKTLIYGKQMRLSIAETGESITLAFLISYVGEEWLFINGVKLLVDGEPFELNIHYLTDVKRDVNYGSVSEIVVVPIVSSNELLNFNNSLYIKLLKGISRIEVKYVGDKSDVEFELTNKQITGIIETLRLYEHLKLKY